MEQNQKNKKVNGWQQSYRLVNICPPQRINPIQNDQQSTIINKNGNRVYGKAQNFNIKPTHLFRIKIQYIDKKDKKQQVLSKVLHIGKPNVKYLALRKSYKNLTNQELKQMFQKADKQRGGLSRNQINPFLHRYWASLILHGEKTILSNFQQACQHLREFGTQQYGLGNFTKCNIKQKNQKRKNIKKLQRSEKFPFRQSINNQQIQKKLKPQFNLGSINDISSQNRVLPAFDVKKLWKP